MVGESVLIGAAALFGVAALVYALLHCAAQGQALRGIRKRFWCDGKQRVVDVDFMAVNRNEYDVMSCTAFAEDQTVSCDKHCVKVVEEDTSQAVGKGSAPDQGSAPQPAFPGNGR
jgi:hypothetical protein